MGPAQRFRSAIARQLTRISPDIDEPAVLSLLGTPKVAGKHQFSLPIPKLVASCHPGDHCKDLADRFQKDASIERATASGPILHFDVRPDEYVRETLLQVHRDKERYGWCQSESRKQPTVVIDYSSPNIAKPFHAGHLRSTILGNFIKRVHEALGYNAVGINYLGDWGKQYGLLAVGFEKYGDERLLERDPIHHLYNVYVQINRDAAADPSIDKQANNYFRRMEEGDQSALRQWQTFRDMSIASYKQIYKRLNIEFDQYSGESQTDSYLPRVYDQLRDKGLIVPSDEQDGAWVIDLAQLGLGKPVVQRADGTSLYLTRDLAAVWMRRDAYAFDKAIYVVGTEQDLHLKQVFKVSELMCEKQDLQHACFGRIQGMSTRKGTTVFLQDILDTAKEKMLENMQEEKHQYKLDELARCGIHGRYGQDAIDYVADRLGTSAVIVQDMVAKRIKNYAFSWDRMTAARGYTGVYLQFTYARLCGIERKSNVPITPDCDLSLLKEKEAFELALTISQFPDIVQSSGRLLEPSQLVQYLFKLSHATSQASTVLRVKDMEPELAKARMLLFWAAKVTLGNGLWLIGIDPLERM